MSRYLWENSRVKFFYKTQNPYVRHKWFAWYPVVLHARANDREKCFVWLTFIERYASNTIDGIRWNYKNGDYT